VWGLTFGRGAGRTAASTEADANAPREAPLTRAIVLQTRRPVSRLLLGLLLSALCLATPATAAAPKRVALVIGNSDYRNVAHLENPANDAKLMAKTLRDLGFTLVGGDAELDLDKTRFDTALQDFSNQVVGADVALFYYAGHGVQVNGRNFLVPVEANPTKEADVYLQTIDTSIVLSQMEGSGTKLNIVLLDACRNNPFSNRGLRAISGGLAQMEAPEGTLISYATQPGNVALDGQDGDSPYSEAVAETIRRPGLGLFDTFNQIGVAVKRATGGQQQPWLASSPIEGGFYFAGQSGAVAIASAEPVAKTVGADEAANAAMRGATSQQADSVSKDVTAKPSPPAERPQAPATTTTPPTSVTQAPAAPAAPEHQVASLSAQPTLAPAAPADVVATCDRLAGAPSDPQRSSGEAGRKFADIPAGPAVAACRAALTREPNNPRLAFELGRAEIKGRGDEPEAVALIRQAADAKYAAALNLLGFVYERGLGAPRDLEEAMKWYRRGADAGDGAAMHRLGVAYRNGDVVKMDLETSLAWFRRSAQTGDATSMMDLSRAYQFGWGVPANPAEAARWRRKAEAAGATPEPAVASAYVEGPNVAPGAIGVMQAPPPSAGRWGPPPHGFFRHGWRHHWYGAGRY
jgi:uncharacterized caspase-like protein